MPQLPPPMPPPMPQLPPSIDPQAEHPNNEPPVETGAVAANGAVTASDMIGLELSARDKALLEFEKRRFNFAGTKQQAIAREFGFSETRYYQEILRLVRLPGALAAEPVLVNRLRRVLIGGEEH